MEMFRGDSDMPQFITVTEAAQQLTEIVDLVSEEKRTYLLTRDGVVVAQITPVAVELTGADWQRRWPTRPRLEPEDGFGWADEAV
jgi:hypothetical protein